MARRYMTHAEAEATLDNPDRVQARARLLPGRSPGYVSGRATVRVTAGAPGAVTLSGAANGVAASLQTAASPVVMRVARLTFTFPQPDANYFVGVQKIYDALDGGGDALYNYQYVVVTKTTTHFEIGVRVSTTGAWGHIDVGSHTFDVTFRR